MARSLMAAGASRRDIIHVAYGYGLFTGGLGAHYGAERLGATTIPVSGGGTRRQAMTELTLATDLSSKQREYLEMARHSAQSLLTVLNDIVDYARIETGALELAKTPFDLTETVEEVMVTVGLSPSRSKIWWERRKYLSVNGI